MEIADKTLQRSHTEIITIPGSSHNERYLKPTAAELAVFSPYRPRQPRVTEDGHITRVSSGKQNAVTEDTAKELEVTANTTENSRKNPETRSSVEEE